MPMTDEMGFVDATTQAEMVRNGDVTPAELVEGAIERVERLNPALNAVITPMYDEAREAASRPIPEGPFSGVPFLVKDFLAEYAGVRFTESSNFIGDFVPDEDAELVKRWKRAGLIAIGKTNLPEMAIGATTEPVRFGPTRNPWDTTRTPGGSSGGAGAAVASGMVAMAHGNDAGGSIRIPAACCGVFGLKPTRGRNPLGPHFGDMLSGLVAEHALTRSVRDSAALLDATAGPSVGDPYWAPPQRRPYVEEVSADPGKLRVAFSKSTLLGNPLHPDCLEAVVDAANLCESLGHEVVEATPSEDWETLWSTFTTVMATGFGWAVADWTRRLGREPEEGDLEPFVADFAERGRRVSGPQYLLHIQEIHRLSRGIAEFFESFDVWLTPTLGEPPVTLGTLVYDGGDPIEHRRRTAGFAPFTFVGNVTGQPGMSVPLSWNGDGLPVGSHFLGRFGDEATLFRLAAQLERARPLGRQEAARLG